MEGQRDPLGSTGSISSDADGPLGQLFSRLIGALTLVAPAPLAALVLAEELHLHLRAARGLSCGRATMQGSLFAAAMTSGATTIVSDTLGDPRFAAHPLVCGPPHIAAYASAPICGRDGAAIGCLALMDTQPRAWTSTDLAALVEFAALTADAVALASAPAAAPALVDRSGSALAAGDRAGEGTVREPIGERQRLVEAAIASSDEAVMITEASPLHDPGPAVVYINPAFALATGFAEAEVIGRSPQILRESDTDPVAWRRVWAALVGRERTTVELRQQRKDGTSYWAEMTVAPVPGAQGGVTHFSYVLRDIDARKRVEIEQHETTSVLRQRLRESAAQVETTLHQLEQERAERRRAEQAVRSGGAFTRALLDALLAHVAVIDADGCLLTVNTAWERFATENDNPPLRVSGPGTNYLRALGQGATRGDADAAEALANLETLLAGQAAVIAQEYALQTREGTRWFVMQGSPLEVGGGRGAVLVHLELSELRETQRALAESEARFRAFVDAAPDAMVIIDDRGQVLVANAQTQRLFGHPAEALVGSPVDQLISDRRHDLSADAARGLGDRTRVALATDEIELCGRRADGSEFPIDVTLNSLQYHGSNLVIAAIRDVTERKRAAAELRRTRDDLEVRVAERTEALAIVNEQLRVQLAERQRAERALRKSEERYRTLVRNFPGGIVTMYDLDLRYTLADGLALAELGLSSSALEGRRIWETFPPALCEQVEPIYRDALAGATTTREVSYADHTYAIHSLPLRNELGEIVAGLSVALDITDRLRAEAAVHESEARYRLLFEKAAEAIWIVDTEGEQTGFIRQANQAAAAMLGYSVSELERMHLREIQVPSSVDANERRLRRVLDGEWVEGDASFMRRDGAVFPVEFAAGLLELGGHRYMLAFARDATERQRTQAALREAKEAAEAANRAKSAFLANISHEIRTPMNAILGYTQLLRRDPQLTPGQLDSLEVIGSSGDHLLSLINDVLDMAKIEAGRMTAQLRAVDLYLLLDDLERMFRVRTDAKGLELRFKRATDVPRYVTTDESKLRQVLVNLLGNAVKFTAQGRVVVQVTSSGSRRLFIDVADTGPGIAQEELASLFRPFSQAGLGRNAQGGTGLGLALSREYARLLGGDITASSMPGAGSVFRLQVAVEPGTLPRPVIPALAQRVIGLQPRDQAPRVLIADDVDTSRMWLGRLLADVGFAVTESRSGEEALRAFAQHAHHLLLLDMRMPGMDGYATIRAVRAMPGGNQLRIIVATANAFDVDEEAILDSGADGYLRKPLREAELFAALRQQLGVDYRYATPQGTPMPVTAAARPEAVAELPAALRRQMRAAVDDADVDRLYGLIEQLDPALAAVAELLRGHAERFEYDLLAELLAP